MFLKLTFILVQLSSFQGRWHVRGFRPNGIANFKEPLFSTPTKFLYKWRLPILTTLMCLWRKHKYLIPSTTTYWSSDYGYGTTVDRVVSARTGTSHRVLRLHVSLPSSDLRRSTRPTALAHFCSSCTRLTSHPSLPCATFVPTRMPTTLNSTRPARLLMVQRRPLNYCAVSTTSTGGCAPTGWNLTPTKQFIWLEAPRQLQQVSSVQLIVDGVPVLPSDTVRDLDVTLDAQLSLQVDNVVRSCFYQLKQLRSVRRSVPHDAVCTLVGLHAFVTTTVTLCCTASQQKSLVGCR